MTIKGSYVELMALAEQAVRDLSYRVFYLMSCARTSMSGNRKPAARQKSAALRCPYLNAITTPSVMVISKQIAIAMTIHWRAGELSVDGFPALSLMLM